MATIAYPEPAPAKPLWLMTLADLALLLVGFFVLLQASEKPRAVTDALRHSFGGSAAPASAPPAIPVMAAGLFDFAPGSAALPDSPAAVIAWAREAARDPRVALTVTGSTDGSANDVDTASGSAAILAADRARALALVLAPVTRRVTVTSAARPGRRAAIVSLAFVGEHPNGHQP
ncbi:hypothetical protein M9979_15085 [Sphingomonas sp. RP10(2022)]|uniref:Flagellar motor protein MotB n=1 Tax=Sphingomonas liriopis TaxID=2949094 RepID=A0A9X2HUK9_9SPHN|nr:hypothetical protein [Sphingomonas liriopis]MCP3736192.1 hypothetical protein [Sphingomonas liriopis]